MLSSEGVEASGITTSHGLGVQVSIEENGQMTSSWESCSSRKLMEGIPSCVPMAVDWARKTRDPISVETQPVDTPVLLTPQGISSLFSNIIRPSILGERMVRKESYWSEKMNELVLDQHLTMLDNRRMEGGFASSSRDGEGVPTSCHTIVENGVLRKMIWSSRDAAKNVAEGRIDEAMTTGSASRGSHMSPPTTGCGDVQLLSSNKGQTRDELVETMNQGYIVHSVMGAHTANPTSGDFSVTTSTILELKMVKSKVHSNKQVYLATCSKQFQMAFTLACHPPTMAFQVRAEPFSDILFSKECASILPEFRGDCLSPLVILVQFHGGHGSVSSSPIRTKARRLFSAQAQSKQHAWRR